MELVGDERGTLEPKCQMRLTVVVFVISSLVLGYLTFVKGWTNIGRQVTVLVMPIALLRYYFWKQKGN